ncbi:hypothetical protein GQ53DRAFT_854373 [Thozetella sp. PMI_491]|nr:hypothetical protein GQ53DRAFT_854373 [Thozetella sp. PMI_491]
MDDPSTETRDGTLIGVEVTLLAFATIAVSLRIYTRAYIVKRIWYDDWAIVVALLFWLTALFYHSCLLVTKASFLMQYYRIFPLEKVQKTAIVLGVLISCWGLSQLLVVILGCQPIQAFWDLSVHGNCVPAIPLWYINAGGNLITDLIILIFPLPILHSLRLPMVDKVSLFGVFCLGFLTSAISIVRIKFLHPEEDFTWWNVDAALWHSAELCCAITCSCLPTLRSFLTKFVPSLSTEYSRRAYYG